MRSAMFLLGLAVGIAAGRHAGWTDAHLTVATECERLGSFYVGTTTYECKPRAK